jgi:hypothetical protein
VARKRQGGRSGASRDIVAGVGITLAPVAWWPSSRIILSDRARRGGASPLDRLGVPDDVDALVELTAATDPAALAALGRIDLVPPRDRVVGPGAGLVMAAFTFPGFPSRFSDGSYGVYYAAEHEATAVAETRYHHGRRLAAGRVGPVVLDLTLLHADLVAPLYDLTTAAFRASTLARTVYDPDDYSASQRLGMTLRRDLGAFGTLYESVRDPGGRCAAVFRPPALSTCRPARALHYHWDGARITRVS